MIFILGILFSGSFCCASEDVSDNKIRFIIERGKDEEGTILDSWKRSIDAPHFDNNLLVMYEYLDSALFSERIAIGYDRDNSIDYTDSQGLDDLLKVIGNFGYNKQTNTVIGNEQLLEVNTIEKALEKTKQHYINSTAKTVQQSLLWAQKLQLQEGLINVLVDVYVDALLKTDFIKNARDVRYCLPLAVDLDKKVAKNLVSKILKTDFSDQSKNYSLEYEFTVHDEIFATLYKKFEKSLIKSIEKKLVASFYLEKELRLSMPLNRSSMYLDYVVFDVKHVCDVCWIGEKLNVVYEPSVSNYNPYIDKDFITVSSDGFVRLHDKTFVGTRLVQYTVRERHKIRLTEFNSDQVNTYFIKPENVDAGDDYKSVYQLTDASIVAGATGAIYVGFGNTLYKMRVKDDKLSIEIATIVSDNLAQITGLFLKNDTIAVTYKRQPSKDVFSQWGDLEEQYAYYKIVDNQFISYEDKPAGFETLDITWRMPLSDRDKITKRKSFLISHDDKLISIKDVLIGRGLNNCDNCYDVTFDDEFQQLFMLTKDKTSYAEQFLFVRKYDVIPLQLISLIHALNEKAKNIKQDQVIVGESLTYDVLLYIHNHHKHLAPNLRISHNLKSITKRMQAFVSSNPLSKFYRYVRNSYFALGGHKKEELKMNGFLLVGGTAAAALVAFLVWQTTQDYRSGIMLRPQNDRYGMPIDANGFSWWEHFSKR